MEIGHKAEAEVVPGIDGKLRPFTSFVATCAQHRCHGALVRASADVTGTVVEDGGNPGVVIGMLCVL